jgi:hypothetical protein
LEEVVRTRFSSLETAFDVTQYLRGHLYIFVDLLLTSEHTESDLPDIYSFLHLVIKAISLWLKMFSTDLLKAFIEYRQYPTLTIIDRNCALAACSYEFLDILGWLFALCPRTGVFFGVRFCIMVEI